VEAREEVVVKKVKLTLPNELVKLMLVNYLRSVGRPAMRPLVTVHRPMTNTTPDLTIPGPAVTPMESART
jgi:hypothetical protein